MKRSTQLVDIREITVLALLAAILVAQQVVLVALPNVEIVTMMIILATVHLGWKVLFSVTVFIILEGFIYGFGMWWVNWLYVWYILVAVVMALRKYSHPVLWTLVAGIYGLIFGVLCSVPYFITGGWAAGITYIITGIPYDITHCVGNVVFTALLFYPLDKIFGRCVKSVCVKTT